MAQYVPNTLKRLLKRCIDWSKIDKHSYLKAKKVSVTDPKPITDLLSEALIDQIYSRALYRKGIDYSYYYEEDDFTEAPN